MATEKPSEKPYVYGITDIKSYIPLILDLNQPNYDSWCELFETHCIGFGVSDHLEEPTERPPAETAEWNRIDSIVKMWIYGAVSQSLLQTILKKNASARQVWLSLETIFRGNEDAKAIQLGNNSGNITLVDLLRQLNLNLEKGDYTMISGNSFIEKSGWQKISLYFNISYEIKEKSIQYDDSHQVQRAEFLVRAHMKGGRFCDGFGSCGRREERCMFPNQGVPSTAETRAKNKACQGLLGFGGSS